MSDRPTLPPSLTGGMEFSEDELRVANAIARNPSFVCLDAVNVYEFADDPEPADPWASVDGAVSLHTGPGSVDLPGSLGGFGDVGESPGATKTAWFTDKTCRVEVCQVQLLSERERRAMRRKFRFTKLFSVVSDLPGIMPASDTVVVGFPVKESEVVDACRRFLRSRQYHEHQDHFLWGENVVAMEG